MSHPTLRRALIAGVASAVGLGGLLASPAQAADPAPESDAASWLAAQLDQGLFTYTGFDSVDHGVNIDAGFALVHAGRDARAAQLRDDLEPTVDTYFTGDSFGDAGSTYANALGKTLSFVAATDGDVTDYDGVDLVTRLEGQVDGAGATEGRIRDTSDFGDNANVLGQAFAADGLAAAGSDQADEVTGFLLQQQCAEGFFRLYFSDAGDADQSCDGAVDAPEASTDVTALVMLQLLGSTDEPGVSQALDAGAAWLVSQQRANGSFAGAPPTDVPNANSTGLPGWALGELGRDRAAARAAVWVRQHQLAVQPPCRPYAAADRGAVCLRRGGLPQRHQRHRRVARRPVPPCHGPGRARPGLGPLGHRRDGPNRSRRLRSRGLDPSHAHQR